MGAGAIVNEWDKTYPLFKPNNIRPTHFYRLETMAFSARLSVKSIPWRLLFE